MPARPRVALALSGGGFRASVFHLGVLRRLAELGQLPRVDVVSAVSGGSIVGAFLALRWSRVMADGGDATALERHVTTPFLELVRGANFILDWAARVPLAVFRRRRGTDFSRAVVAADLYDERLYGGASLSDLPETPRLILNATSLPSIRAWRFTRDGMGDSRYGYARFSDAAPVPRLSVGVAASAAFPPVFSPLRIRLDDREYSAPLYGEARPDVGREMPLSDGGVYDNLALEVLTRNKPIPLGASVPPPEILVVSDAGHPAIYRFEPWRFPLLASIHLLGRVRDVALEQVVAQRRRILVEDLREARDGIRGTLVPLAGGVDHLSAEQRDRYVAAVGAISQIPPALLAMVRGIRTSLDRFSAVECEALMYHAYVSTDAGWWAHLGGGAPPEPPPWRIEFDSARLELWARELRHSAEWLRVR